MHELHTYIRKHAIRKHLMFVGENLPSRAKATQDKHACMPIYILYVCSKAYSSIHAYRHTHFTPMQGHSTISGHV